LATLEIIFSAAVVVMTGSAVAAAMILCKEVMARSVKLILS
jgi:hypothetical protein